MIAKRVVLSHQARRDIRDTTAWYRKEGGTALAQRWVNAVERGVRHLGAHPKTGITRYAVQLNLDELRFWPLDGFPYLLFYFERPQHIEVGRVLHAQRDVPAWMGEGELR